jgi:hypothetical protein
VLRQCGRFFFIRVHLRLLLNSMARTNLFFKVEVEHSEKDRPEKLANEILRHLLKLYGVRSAELSSYNIIEE